MRLITYHTAPTGEERIGVRVGHRVLDIESASRVDGEPLPSRMKVLLAEGRGKLARVQALAKAAQTSAGRFAGAMVEERAIRFRPPVPDAGRFVHVGENVREDGEAPAMPAFEEAGVAEYAGHEAKRPAHEGLEAPQVVFVIGRALADAEPDEAAGAICGVTVLGPAQTLGPEIATIDEIADIDDLWITCCVNGEERLRYNTRDLALPPAELIARLSRTAPLGPGDLVSAGAPRARLELRAGEVVECAIEGVTVLRTPLTAQVGAT